MLYFFYLFIFFISCKLKTEPISDNLIQPSAINASFQKIEVVTEGLEYIKASMILYDRNIISNDWEIKDSFAVVVGKNGLAYDYTQIIYKEQKLKIKHEGDGCSPTGYFTLGKVFSYHLLSNLKMPFEQVDENDLCVDDVHSIYYNILIDDDTVITKDYSSFERMQRKDEQYEYGVWVNYNTDPQVKGNGSCIFLHIWKNENSGTSGCTAMSKENMLKLIEWLDKEKNPILYQYTRNPN